MRNQFVILAAGKGTRMAKANVPKVLMMLHRKPLILHLLHEVEKINHLIKPVVVIGFMAEQVKGVLGDDYLYAYQNQQLGTAHALLAAENLVRAQNILVLNGDMPFVRAESLRKLIRLHFQNEGKISLCTALVESFQNQGRLFEHFGRILRASTISNSKQEQGQIIGIVEFKDADQEQRKLREINSGIYMFNTAWLWDNLRKIANHNAQGEYYLTDIIKIAVVQGVQVNSVLIDPQEAIGINSEADLQLAEQMLTTSN